MNPPAQHPIRSPISRREFFRVSVLAGVGLTIGIYLPGCSAAPTLSPQALTPTPAPTPTPQATATPEPPPGLEPSIYVTLDNRGGLTVKAFRSEMGQGIRTAIAMILAEELDADWGAVRIEQVGANPAYGNQVTGGSVSVSGSYAILRRAGAAARQVLVAAAAQQWGVEVQACRTEKGWVIHPDGSRRLAYGELVEAAMQLPVTRPGDVSLKAPQDFRIINTPRTLYDAARIVQGSAVYGLDVRLPGMVYAAVARCPVFEGKVAGFDATKAKAVAGVRHVIQIESGVAVVAESTWAAMQGRGALDITWDEGQYAGWSSASIRDILLKLAPQMGAAAADKKVLEAAYDIPYLAHATMEPMNCVADVRADRCEVWAPTQNPQQAKRTAQSITRLPADAVAVHVPLLGGGFGRRHQPDFVAEAVQISKSVGAPVQVVWTRADDLQHDFYHPLSYNYVKTELDDAGRPTTMPRVQSHPMTIGVPTGAWRSVENFTEAFARESFLDEIAAASRLDPYQLRLALLSEPGRRVLQLAATQAGWGTPLPDRQGRGIAYYATFGVTHVAQVAEVSVAEDGTVRVNRVVCAVDCGTVINPDTVVAQMEGGIVFGLTAALKAEITIEKGRTQQSNFNDYPLLAMDEMPVVEVHIVPGDGRSPTGIGEMGVPPIAPAVANAVFAATGVRVRHLPIRPADLRKS
jgi:isoquinoline 1-oxidoreductase beta subunit